MFFFLFYNWYSTYFKWSVIECYLYNIASISFAKFLAPKAVTINKIYIQIFAKYVVIDKYTISCCMYICHNTN